MNTNLLSIVKRIIAEQGEDILDNPQRLKAFFTDYAKDEPKQERVAFGRCMEMGAYRELKIAGGTDGRQRAKADLANRMSAQTGIDRAQCADALDLLEAATFGAEQATCANDKAGNDRPTYNRPATDNADGCKECPFEKKPACKYFGRDISEALTYNCGMLASDPNSQKTREKQDRRSVLGFLLTLAVFLILFAGLGRFLNMNFIIPTFGEPVNSVVAWIGMIGSIIVAIIVYNKIIKPKLQKTHREKCGKRSS